MSLQPIQFLKKFFHELSTYHQIISIQDLPRGDMYETPKIELPAHKQKAMN